MVAQANDARKSVKRPRKNAQKRPESTEENAGPRNALKNRGLRGTFEPVSTATTQGIRVSVAATYVPEQSSPRSRRYVFAYTVKISNEGNLTAHLRTRHWVITDGNGKVEEVRGPGVVGQQPLLNPGDHFEYTSGCVLETPRGQMHGSYQMVRPDGTEFDATIAPFSLLLPTTLN